MSDPDADLLAAYERAHRPLPDAALDAAILRAAARTVRLRALQRRLCTAAAVAGVGAILWIGIDRDQKRTGESAQDFGMLEGRSRAFLLRRTADAGIGPGSMSFVQIERSSEGR